MDKFGVLKSKMLIKLTESYNNKNKKETKNILNTIKENKDFKEMYLFYEDIENMELSLPDSAQLYVETVEPLLIDKSKSIKSVCEKISKIIGDVKYDKNELYECLDIISEKSSLSNLDKKVIAKKKLIEHLTTKKEIKPTEEFAYTMNENLLMAVMSNNFNVLYDNTLNEEEKKELKDILSLKDDEINLKMSEIKESILSIVNNLITESKDDELKNKLNKVIDEVNSSTPSKYNLYKLKELKNGLN